MAAVWVAVGKALVKVGVIVKARVMDRFIDFTVQAIIVIIGRSCAVRIGLKITIGIVGIRNSLRDQRWDQIFVWDGGTVFVR